VQNKILSSFKKKLSTNFLKLILTLTLITNGQMIYFLKIKK